MTPTAYSGGLVTVGETMALLSVSGVARLRHARHLVVGVAGAESNVAIGVRRLGRPATWVGRVGDDELGALIVGAVRGEGVDVRAIPDGEVPTSLMLKERRTAQVSRVTYYRVGGPGSRLRPDDVDGGLVEGAGVLHLTGITPALSESAADTTRAVIERARAAGVPVSFDLNYRAALWDRDRAAVLLRELVAGCDLVFAAEDEAELLGLAGEPGDQAAGLADLGPKQAVVKLGARGAVAVADSTRHEVQAHPVEVADPVGAGDAFVAGYLAEVLAGAGVEQRLTTAAACGAFAVSAAGDWEGMPTRADLAALDVRSGTVLR